MEELSATQQTLPQCAPKDHSAIRWDEVEFIVHPQNAFPQLKSTWQTLEKDGVGCAYHTFSWCLSWAEHLSKKERARAVVVVATHQEQPILLLPLAFHKHLGITTARWLAEDLLNQNTGFWKSEALYQADANQIRQRIKTALTARGVDTIALCNMPQKLEGSEFPLADKSFPTSPNAIYPFALSKPWEELLKSKRSKAARKKHRSKLSKLQEQGLLEFCSETTSGDQSTAVEAMLSQREARQQATGIPTAFSKPAYQRFITQAFVECAAENSAVKPRFYTLKLDGSIISTCLALSHHGRLYCYSTSIACGDLQRFSPGELLMQHAIEDACNTGLHTFDFGLGEERFKLSWSEPEHLKDWIQPISLKGKAWAKVQLWKQTAKRTLRNNPSFWALYRRARHLFAKLKV